MSEQNNKKEKKLTVYDAFIAIFYIIIVAIGGNMCITRGESANSFDLVAVTVSVVGVLSLKLAKYKGQLKEHRGDIAFVALLAILGVFAVISTVIL